MKVSFSFFTIVSLLFLVCSAQAQDSDNGQYQQDQTQKAPQAQDTVAPGNHINAKSLNDTNELDGGPARAPTSGGGGDLPYSDEEMKQADPGVNNKNMPVDQD